MGTRVSKVNIMSALTITAEEWATLKLKFKRKYNHLSEEDLAFAPGQEEELINRLAKRVNRDRDYVIFTLKKGLLNLEGNRL